MAQTDSVPTHSPWQDALTELGHDGLLSVIMPAHNLATVLEANTRTVVACFKGHIPFEVVLVDDGSQDATADVARRLSSQLPEVRHVILPRNMGKGAAIHHGFEASRGSHILFLDADLDLPPGQTSLFFSIMLHGNAGAVIGAKRHPDSKIQYPWHRRVVSSVYFWLVKLMIGLPVRDTQTGIKLFRRRPLERVMPKMLVKRFAFDLELLAILHEDGCHIAEAPVTLDFQLQGNLGCVSTRSIIQIFTDTLAIFYRLRLLNYYQSLPPLAAGPAESPLVSILIAYPDITDYLHEALAGIALQTYKNYEVILLPQAASGRTWPAGIRELPTGNVRPAEKRNMGLSVARGSIIAFLDDDAWPEPHWLEAAVACFADHDVGAVGGPGSTPPNDPFMAQLSGRVYSNVFVSGNYRGRYKPMPRENVEDVPSCNLLVRTNIMKELGGFHTEFWPGEDTYLCMEVVHRCGKRIVYDPRVHVYHHRRKLFLPHMRQIGRYALHRGYFARHFPSTSRRIGYMMPSLFVAGLVVGLPMACLWMPCRILYVGVLTLYALATGATAFSLSPATWLITWLGIFLTHVTYGTRFMMGLIAPTMPQQLMKFDHPSEEKVNGEK